jgi:hypothetical protein
MLELNLGIFESVLASPGLFEEVELNQNVPYSTKSILSNISTLFAGPQRELAKKTRWKFSLGEPCNSACESLI